MKIVSAQTMRELDRRTIAAGIPGEELMQTAGEGLADAIRRLAGNHQLVDAPSCSWPDVVTTEAMPLSPPNASTKTTGPSNAGLQVLRKN